MALDQGLVSINDTLDKGRQYFNEAVTSFYNIELSDIPSINGLIKAEYNPIGKSRLLGRINDEWVILGYEDPVASDIFYYDETTGKIMITKDLSGKNSEFTNVRGTNSGTFKTLTSTTGVITTLTVDELNVRTRINQTDVNQLAVEDNTILLNANLNKSSGSPDDAGYLYAGVIVRRGSYEDASIRWDEIEDRWIANIPDTSGDETNTRIIELLGFEVSGENNRKVNLINTPGLYFDSESENKDPGLYIQHEDYVSGIYYDSASKKYIVKDASNKGEILGIDLLGTHRKVKVQNSAGIEIHNAFSDEPAGISFIQENSNGDKIGTGTITYDSERDKLFVTTNNASFELKDIDSFDAFGDSWYYSESFPAGTKTIVLPDTKIIKNTTKDLLQVYVNGIHISPTDYDVDIIDSGNNIIFHEPLSEDSTVTIYNHIFMSNHYRLPLKTIPETLTGQTGKELYGSLASASVAGELQSVVLKNSKILIEGKDYTLQRLTSSQYKLLMEEEVKDTDEIVVFPFLTPNIFAQNENTLIFKTHLENPDSITAASADILFDRGNGTIAGLRWNERTNALEINTGNGIWDAITGSSSRFGRKQYTIAESTSILDISDLLAENSLINANNITVTVFNNGILLDNYTINNNKLVFDSPLSAGAKVWVYIGKSFIKSHNDLVSKKFIKEIHEITNLLKFDKTFTYQPGSDTLNIFINGILTQKGIDYIELDENSVLFNYNLEPGTIVQAYTPVITTSMQYAKKEFVFDITGGSNYLNSDQSNCFIKVNRGADANSAYIKWDEEKDAWYLNNGDGKFKRILTAANETEERQFTQVAEFYGINGATLDVSSLKGHPDKVMVFKDGKLLLPKGGVFDSIGEYYYYPDLKKITFSPNLTTSSKIVVLAYTSGEIHYINHYRNTYTQRYSKVLSNEKSVTIYFNNATTEDPEVLVFVDGNLSRKTDYSLNFPADHKYVDITFSEPQSCELDVVINSNNTQASLINGVENSLVFENDQENYDDTKATGNWYLKSDRGKSLPPAYIKWDEVKNEFKFNPGKSREYSFAKVVFADELFTPEHGEEIFLIKKDTMVTYAYYNDEWHDLSQKTVVTL